MSALRIYLQVVKGSSPFWIRILVGILRIWFFIYDCLNYIPYQLFNSPVEKLRKSDATKVGFAVLIFSFAFLVPNVLDYSPVINLENL
ncbi:unnamed protein product [Nippostrongylus brasiliensis]|uniref:Preprotein translocase subunit SecY n=1 Tax=Nippostrongylus brasiliensis TaxID=27835 RepID=A0A0N4XIM4_NIPBR|nr:unnamed protein product [Nippostrongylus brasiliensis]